MWHVIICPVLFVLFVVMHGEVHVLLLLPGLLCNFVFSCLNNSFDDKKISPQSAHGKVYLSPLAVAAPLHVFSCLSRVLYSENVFLHIPHAVIEDFRILGPTHFSSWRPQ